MTRRMSLSGGLIVAALVIVTAAAAGGRAEESIERSVPAPPDGTVTIKNTAGTITVEGWGEAKLTVTGTLGSGTERLDVTTEGRRTIVEVVLPHHASHVEGSDLRIRLPQGSRVEVEAVSATVEVAGITGALDLHAISGDITARGAAREVTAQTVSGAIVIEATTAKVAAESVSGDITAGGVRGDIELSTVSGDVSLKAAGEVDRLRFSSVSGELRFDGSLSARAILKAETHSGDITLALGSRPAGDFSVTTFSGEIENAFGPRGKRASRYAPGRELEFTLGDGGARVDVTTFSGDVFLLEH
ncbi:MAG: DUF4097 family beta strand repeat-containing protein [Candidatus Krumholzibacteriia bacterium]